MRKIAIVANNKEETQKVNQELKEKIEQTTNLVIDDKNPDIVIAIGGDGTIISAFHKYNHLIDHVAFVGIHTGHLGFYTAHDVSVSEIIETLSAKNVPTFENPLLEATVVYESGKEAKLTSLNEITFRRIIQTVKADVYINGFFFESFNGDGLCVSTPSGSTAYNKSLGGAIVSPTLPAIQMSEMASINNRVYRTLSSSVVIGPEEWITLKLKCGEKDKYFIGYDGAEFTHKTQVSKIIYRVSPKKIKFILINRPEFWRRVRQSFIGQTDVENQ